MWKREPVMTNSPAISLSATTHDTKEWDVGTTPKKTSVLGSSIKLEGVITGEDDVMLQGRVKGRIDLPNNTVTVGVEGFLEGDVMAQVVIVEGAVKGNIRARERVILHQTAQLIGNITCDRVSIEEGAKVNGSIDMAPRDARSEAKIIPDAELENEETLSH